MVIIDNFFLSNLRRPIKLLLNSPTRISGSGVYSVEVWCAYQISRCDRSWISRTGLKLMFFDISLFKLLPPPFLIQTHRCCESYSSRESPILAQSAIPTTLSQIDD